MVEVEIKVPVTDREVLEKRLIESGFTEGDTLKESDNYFDNACGQIRGNGQALRIRCCENLKTGRTEYYMTFKGAKMDQVSMSRTELEMQIESANTAEGILAALGYNSVRPVIKLRRYYHRDAVTACLDQVEELGCFMELELVVSDESGKEEALARVFSVLYELGYKKENVINTSYLSLLQGKEK